MHPPQHDPYVLEAGPAASHEAPASPSMLPNVTDNAGHEGSASVPAQQLSSVNIADRRRRCWMAEDGIGVTLDMHRT